MLLILYQEDVSPPCHAVRLTAKALGIPIQLKFTDLEKGEHMIPQYLKMNPAHTVPTLDDDGYFIGENRAIIAYLVNRYGKDDKLYPKDPKARGLVDNMLYFDGTNLYPSFANYFYPIMLFNKPGDPELKAIVEEELNVLDTILCRQAFAAGEHLTIADISLICSLSIPECVGNFDFTGNPNMRSWRERVKTALPFYEEITKKGCEELRAWEPMK